MPHEALFAAVQAGNLRAVEQALDALGAQAPGGAGAAIGEVVDAQGHTVATWAAGHGQAGVLRALHARGVDLRAPDGNGQAPAHLAARAGHGAVLMALDGMDVDLTAHNRDGLTPAHVADVRALGALQALGFDLREPDANGFTLAHHAAQRGAVDTLSYLRDQRIDLSQANALGNAAGVTPAHVAAEHNQMDALKEMIGWGVAMPRAREWPARLAEVGPQRVNQAAVVAAIAELEAGGGVEQTNLASDLTCPVTGCTPAHIAAQEGRADSLRALGALRADLAAPDLRGYKPAHLAAFQGHADALRALGALHVNLGAQDNLERATPAHVAAEYGHVGALRALDELGVDLTTRARCGKTPAQAAAGNRHPEALRLLLAVEERKMHVPAARQGDVTALRELHRLGANLRAADTNGFTLAHHAAQRGAVNALSYLREQGIDLSQPNAAGMAPTHVAAEHEQIDALTAMIRWGVALPREGQWPARLAQVGPQRVNQAAVAAAIAELEASGEDAHKNRAIDLTCPVTLTAYSSEGPHRPVRWIYQDDSGKDCQYVMSASAATAILKKDKPQHPISRQVLRPVARKALMKSEAFVEGDKEHLALVRAARDVMLAGGAEQGRLDRLMGAMQAAVAPAAAPGAVPAAMPEWRRLMQPREGQGQGQEPGRASAGPAPHTPR